MTEIRAKSQPLAFNRDIFWSDEEDIYSVTRRVRDGYYTFFDTNVRENINVQVKNGKVIVL